MAPFARKELRDDFSMFYGGAHAVTLNPRGGNVEGAGGPRRGGAYLEARSAFRRCPSRSVTWPSVFSSMFSSISSAIDS